jgi:hypothetical protein
LQAVQGFCIAQLGMQGFDGARKVGRGEGFKGSLLDDSVAVLQELFERSRVFVAGVEVDLGQLGVLALEGGEVGFVQHGSLDVVATEQGLQRGFADEWIFVMQGFLQEGDGGLGMDGGGLVDLFEQGDAIQRRAIPKGLDQVVGDDRGVDG